MILYLLTLGNLPELDLSEVAQKAWFCLGLSKECGIRYLHPGYYQYSQTLVV